LLLLAVGVDSIASSEHPLLTTGYGLGRNSNFAIDEAKPCENRISLGNARSEVHIHDVIVSVLPR
jgi:hypothetical protein